MVRSLLSAVVLSTLPPLAAVAANDPARIDVYVTPFYDSAGPVVHAGKYSSGLASTDEQHFVSTILAMKKHFGDLSFPELYVGAIRLYDFGYRSEAVYWFYAAQYRGRLFAALVDRAKAGGMGDPGFELLAAQNAFFELVGPTINGYAFGNVDALAGTLRRVRQENLRVPNLRSIYYGVTFVDRRTWDAANAQIAHGLGDMAATLPKERDEIRQQRIENGLQTEFSSLNDKKLPGGL